MLRQTTHPTSRICLLVGSLICTTASALMAGEQCEQCGAPCREYDLTPCTVWVDAMVVETRMQTQIVHEKEQREETYTVFVKKPVKREYKREYCYLEDDVKTTTVVEKQCQVVPVPVTRLYQVKVPHKELREIPCDCPKCSEKGAVPDTYLAEVIVETKEERMEECTEPRLAISTCKRDITYCVKVPKKKSEICATEHTFELVPVEKTRMVDVCVCRVVKTPCEVTVCKKVPQEVHCCDECARHHHLR